MRYTMSISRSVRTSIWSVAFFATIAALIFACTSTDGDAPKEPVAAEPDASPYPDDPGLTATDSAPADPATEVKPEDTETVGELTDSPFGGDTPAPDSATPEETPAPTPADDVEPLVSESTGADTAGMAPPAQEENSGADTADAGETGDAAAPKGKATRYVAAVLLNVRSSASLRAPVVRRLLGGAKIYVTVQGDFAKIKDGQWVRTKYLSAEPTRKYSAAEADAAWRKSKYKDKWKKP
jgi:hypothetical protein